MKWFVTEIHAVCPVMHSMYKWVGPNVPGIDMATAQEYCNNNGLGYCKVIGELVAEIPCKEGSYEPDFSKMVDYEKINQN